MNLAVVLFGPLIRPECRRALGRGWLITVRTLAASALFLAALIVFWICWMRRLSNPSFLPFGMLGYGLIAVSGMALTLALVLAPAVLAGALAGERERGALGLLLTTGVRPREIVLGRVAGKLAQVGLILLAGVPVVVLLGGLSGLNPGSILLLLGVMAAVAIGGGGLAAAVSAVSRRGRDALLTVYLIDLLCLLSPLIPDLGLPGAWGEAVAALNPYACLDELVWHDRPRMALTTVALWLVLGLVGIGLASWRLAPVCLGQLDGARVGRRGWRARRVPPLDDERPMRWKELYVEHAAALGGFGWWIGAALSLALALGSLVLGGIYLADRVAPRRLNLGYPAFLVLRDYVGGSGMYVSWLIQWSVGLRAAVSIASERERGTWDTILTSPLTPREVLLAKLRGSLHALRGLFASALLAWTIAWATGAIPTTTYARLVGTTLTLSAFMAAVGLRTSLASATATRAMAVTLGIWLGAQVVVGLIAGIVAGCATMIFMFAVAPTLIGGASGPGAGAMVRWLPVVTAGTWIVTGNLCYLIAAGVVLVTTGQQFDRLTGRIEPRDRRRGKSARSIR